MGTLPGALVHLVIGAPESRPPAGRVRVALRAHGIEAGELVPVRPQARRSTCFVSGDSPGPGVFVKVVAREWRDTDLLYRTWRRLRRAGRPARQGLPVHEAEHEALMGLLARAAGVRVPGMLPVTGSGPGLTSARAGQCHACRLCARVAAMWRGTRTWHAPDVYPGVTDLGRRVPRLSAPYGCAQAGECRQ